MYGKNYHNNKMRAKFNILSIMSLFFLLAMSSTYATPPAVFDVRPINNSVFNTSNVITISANVTDNITIDTVYANITLPNASVTQLTLMNVSSAIIWNGTYTIPNVIGLYNVMFVANDSIGDINNTANTNFTVNYATQPSTQFQNPTPVNTLILSSNYFPINVSATGNIAVDKITIYVYNSTGLLNESEFSSSPAFINITSLNAGTYTFNATANDTSGNINWTATRNVTVPKAQQVTTDQSNNRLTLTIGSILFIVIIVILLLPSKKKKKQQPWEEDFDKYLEKR